MKIDFQYVFRFLHDSWRRCRANTGRETTIQTQDQFRTTAVRSHGPHSPVLDPETQTAKAVDDAEENHIQHLEKSAVVASRVVSSPSTQTTAWLKSKSWNVQMTWLMTLHTDVGLNSCPCGVIRTILSWICSEMETSVGAVQLFQQTKSSRRRSRGWKAWAFARSSFSALWKTLLYGLDLDLTGRDQTITDTRVCR